MLPVAYRVLLPLMIAALAACGGCQSTTSRCLSLAGLQKEPLAIALVVDGRPTQAIQVLNPFTRYAALQRALSEDLDMPVVVEPCFLFQGEQGLASGWYQLAIVTPAQYAQIAQHGDLRVLAIPCDREHRSTQCALLVAAESSPFRSIEDLRGQTIAFGPPGDSLTHHAALQLLRDAGLRETDLALEPLPVPGSLKHFHNMRSVAQSVINASSQAGFITEAAWESLPELPEQEDQPARSGLRIIARTAALPQTLLVASARLDTAAAQKVRHTLLTAAERRPDVLESLDITGYTVPGEKVLEACRGLVITDRPPDPTERSEPQAEVERS